MIHDVIDTISTCIKISKKKISWGIEPHIHGFQDRHVDHYATKPPQLIVCSLLTIATDSNLHFADCPLLQRRKHCLHNLTTAHSEYRNKHSDLHATHCKWVELLLD